MKAVATVPIQTVNALNTREHWAARHRRNVKESKMIALACRAPPLAEILAAYRSVPPGPVVVELVRIGKRRMDDDGAIASLKAVRDALAAALGVDDGSRLIRWQYAQELGPRYGVRITVDIGDGND